VPPDQLLRKLRLGAASTYLQWLAVLMYMPSAVDAQMPGWNHCCSGSSSTAHKLACLLNLPGWCARARAGDTRRQNKWYDTTYKSIIHSVGSRATPNCCCISCSCLTAAQLFSRTRASSPHVLNTLITLPSALHTGQRLAPNAWLHRTQQHMCPQRTYTISLGADRHTTHTPASLLLLDPPNPASAASNPAAAAAAAVEELAWPAASLLSPCAMRAKALRTRSRAWCSLYRT
jgi:hypothetical protein